MENIAIPVSVALFSALVLIYLNVYYDITCRTVIDEEEKLDDGR